MEPLKHDLEKYRHWQMQILAVIAMASTGACWLIWRWRRFESPQALPAACPSLKRWREFLTAQGSQADQSLLTAHLETCEKCQRELEHLAETNESWSGVARQLGRQPATHDYALRQVMDKLKSETDNRTAPQVMGSKDWSLSFLDPPTQPGQLGRFGRYDVLEEIGRGGMGVVLKAFDPSLQRIVAVKVLAPHLATSGIARRRFTREAQAAAAVSHEHVVTIHEVNEANGLPYIAMQFVPGVSLEQKIDRDGPLPLDQVLRIAHQAACGLAAAHAQGLVHRDIKPANILLLESATEQVKLTDFGLARAVDEAGVTQSGFVAGTPQYMSPEQARGDAVDHRTDLFSLGSTLYAMCTGAVPFKAESTLAVLRKVREEMPRPIAELNAGVPSWLVAIIEKLLAKEPADRFQSAGEVSDMFSQHLAHVQHGAPLPPVRRVVPAGLPSSLTICPSCGANLNIPEAMIGESVDCPECAKPFRVEAGSRSIEVPRPRIDPRNARTGHQSVKALPFKVELLDGIGECNGLLRVEGDYLCLEFQSQYMELVKGSIKQARIPIADISTARLELRWFGLASVLVLEPIRFGAFNNLPGLKPGCVELGIARRNRATAEQFIAELPLGSPHPVVRRGERIAVISNDGGRSWTKPILLAVAIVLFISCAAVVAFALFYTSASMTKERSSAATVATPEPIPSYDWRDEALSWFPKDGSTFGGFVNFQELQAVGLDQKIPRLILMRWFPAVQTDFEKLYLDDNLVFNRISFAYDAEPVGVRVPSSERIFIRVTGSSDSDALLQILLKLVPDAERREERRRVGDTLVRIFHNRDVAFALIGGGLSGVSHTELLVAAYLSGKGDPLDSLKKALAMRDQSSHLGLRAHQHTTSFLHARGTLPEARLKKWNLIPGIFDTAPINLAATAETDDSGKTFTFAISFNHGAGQSPSNKFEELKLKLHDKLSKLPGFSDPGRPIQFHHAQEGLRQLSTTLGVTHTTFSAKLDVTQLNALWYVFAPLLESMEKPNGD